MAEVLTVAAADGVRLSVTDHGPPGAPALLLLHSIGCSQAMWAGEVRRLAATRRVVTVDLRGHGRSDAPEGDYTLERLAADIVQVLDALALPQADICGLSLGGLVAQQLALRAPARVRRLALAATAARIGTAEAWRERARLVCAEGMAAVADLAIGRFFSEGFRAAAPDVVASVRATLTATSPAGYAGCCAALRDADLSARIGAIRAPTLVIGGRHDVSTPPAIVQGLAAAIAGARYEELDAAHLCNLEQPQAFADVLQRFLETD